MSIVFLAAKLMVEGQIIEFENANNFDLTLDGYFDIIRRKTSSLFGAVAQIAAVLAGKPATTAQQYYKFGLDFGDIFQVNDDILDIFSASSGKDRFRDLEEGKITLPFILLLKECETDVKTPFLNADRDELLRLFEKHDIKKLCLEKISAIHSRCVEFLNPFPDSPFKSSLLSILNFIKYRVY